MRIVTDEDNNVMVHSVYVNSDLTQQIIECVNNATCMRSFTMFGAKINKDNAQQIASAICNNKLINNLCFVAPSSSSTDAIVEMVKIFLHNDILQKLSMPFNVMTNDYITQISESLELSKNLKVLEICIHEDTTTGMDHFIKAVTSTKSLEELLVQRKGISQYINVLLGECFFLRKIQLEYCHLDDNDANTIANLLKSSNHIRALNLSNNLITTQGAIVIAEALRSNETLEMLMLHYNKISSREICDIISILESNEYLTHLTLFNVNDNYPSVTDRNKLSLEKRRFARVKPAAAG